MDGQLPATIAGDVSVVSSGDAAIVAGVMQVGQLSVTQHQCSKETGPELKGIWGDLKESLQYEHEKMHIPKIPWLNDWELNFKDYFVNLEIESKYNEETSEVRLKEIFQPRNGKTPTRILFEGPAGYGKTTLAGKLCYDHANREHYVQHFEAVILLRLREFEDTFENLLTDTLGLDNYPAEQVLEAIKANEEKVLFVLDGFDEVGEGKRAALIPLLTCKRFPKSTVIITSRLGCLSVKKGNAESSLTNLVQYVHARVRIKGLTGENKIRFLNLYLNDSPEKLTSTVSLIESKFAKLFQDGLFDCPLFLLLLVIVAEEADINSLKTKTELYKTLFNFVLKRMFYRQARTDEICDFFHFDHTNKPAYVEMLRQFGSFALKALKSCVYSFTEHQLVSFRGTNILDLGILSQNDSKRGLKRKSWFEPIHLSFLEFSAAYHVWASAVSHAKVEAFVNMQNLRTGDFRGASMIGLFIFGLFGEQLATLCTILQNNFECESWLHTFLLHDEDLADESQLEDSDLAKAITPLVAPAHILSMDDECSTPFLIKVLNNTSTVKHVVAQRLYEYTLYAEYTLVGATPATRYWDEYIYENLNEIFTHQNASVYMYSYNVRDTLTVSFTLCEASLHEQLESLSKWMSFDDSLMDIPLQRITFQCAEINLVETLTNISELTRNEKIKYISFFFDDLDCGIPLEPWKEFVSCANKSNELLRMRIEVNQKDPVFVCLFGIEGKTWRRLELLGNVIPCVEWPIVSAPEECTSYLQTIKLDCPVSSIKYRSYVFIQKEPSTMIQGLCELYIIVDTLPSLDQDWNLNYLRNLQILAIGLLHENEEESVSTFCSSLVSIISHCHPQLRLEFWNGWSEKYVGIFLTRLKGTQSSEGRKQEQQIPSKLDTILLTHRMDFGVTEGGTVVKLLKEMLLSGQLRNLWVGSHYKYATPDLFVKDFSPTAGFKCEIGQRIDLKDKPPWWTISYYITISAVAAMQMTPPSHRRCSVS